MGVSLGSARACTLHMYQLSDFLCDETTCYECVLENRCPDEAWFPLNCNVCGYELKKDKRIVTQPMHVNCTSTLIRETPILRPKLIKLWVMNLYTKTDSLIKLGLIACV